MSPDTLTYKYKYQASKEKLFQTLLNEQLKYFSMHDSSIKSLHVGDEIKTTLQTKLQNLDSVTTMKITKIVPNKIFQMVTHQPNGNDIVQTFAFKQNELVYSEKTKLHTVRSQTYFFLVALVYKFFYNRGMKKKLQYLDQLAMN